MTRRSGHGKRQYRKDDHIHHHIKKTNTILIAIVAVVAVIALFLLYVSRTACR